MKRTAEKTNPATTGTAMLFRRDFAGLASVVADKVSGNTPTLVS